MNHSPPLLVIPAHEIDISGQPLAADLPVHWLEAELSDAGAHAAAPAHVEGRVSRSGKADIVVRAKVTAELTLPCARCLEPTPVSVRTELSLLLRPHPGRAAANHHTGKKPAEKKAAAVATPSDKASDKAPENKVEKKVDKKGADKKALQARARDYEFSADEADTDEYDGEEVVLDGFLREAILLELPSFPLCEEACSGFAGAAPVERPPAEPANPLRGELLHLGAELGKVPPPSPSALRRATRATQKKRPRIHASMKVQGPVKGRNKKP
ncbi:MAG: DUF177 domain-containing protein [Polyangiaceae bacterium]